MIAIGSTAVADADDAGSGGGGGGGFTTGGGEDGAGGHNHVVVIHGHSIVIDCGRSVNACGGR